MNIVQPVPEGQDRSHDQARPEEFPGIEGSRRIAQAQQAEQAGGRPEQESVLRAKAAELPPRVELPDSEIGMLRANSVSRWSYPYREHQSQ
jgi:hypothetical protein